MKIEKICIVSPLFELNDEKEQCDKVINILGKCQVAKDQIFTLFSAVKYYYYRTDLNRK